MKQRPNHTPWWAAGLAAGLGVLLPARAFVSQYTPGSIPMFWNFDFYDPDAAPAQNPQTLAIPFTLSQDTASAATRDAEWNAVRAAFAQWEAIPGTKIKFQDAGSIPGPADVSLEDGRNTVVWFSPNRTVCGGTAFFSSSAAALTCLAYLDDGTLVEADMILNRSMKWFTDYNNPPATGPFLESVVLHEVGHLLGLNHSPAGAATMFWLTNPGLTAQAGLSADEWSAARALYGTAATKAASTTLRGTVTLNGAAVFGAVVVSEDANGNLTGATVTQANGVYFLTGLVPGNHSLRVTPLDPNGTTDQYLVRGFDLDEYRRTFSNAATGFQPLTNAPVALAAGVATVRNVAVSAGAPTFRITETRPSYNPADRTSGDYVLQLRRGQTNASVGVYVPGLAGNTATLRLTGGGVTYGATEVIPNALRGMPLVQVTVAVATNAAPGIRSLAVEAGGKTAWANGFIEILPDAPDFNLDGFDDRFQRRWWPLFTQPEARPTADPDNDGWTNAREATAGSNPTDASSVFFRVLSVKVTGAGSVVTAEAAPGRKFQLWSRADLAKATWQTVGTPVTAAGETVQFTDPSAKEQVRFYRVQQVP